MGQRLVIQIEQNGTPLANAYYHWSAYTETAARMTDAIIGYLNDVDPAYTPRQKAVWVLYKTGARFTPSDIEAMADANVVESDFSFAYDGIEANRNDGLIAVTPETMAESVSYEEGHVSIDISTNEIMFDVMCYDDIDSFKENYEDVDIDSLPVFDPPEYLEIDTGAWNTFYTDLLSVLHNGFAISSSKDTVYEFIQ